MTQPHLFNEPCCPYCRSLRWTNTNPPGRRVDEVIPAENVYCLDCGELFLAVHVNGELTCQRSLSE